MKNFVGEDVRLQLAHEEERERARVAAAHGAGVDAAAEVVADHANGHARRALLVFGAERQLESGLRGEVHLHRDRGADDAADERDDLMREVTQHDARVFGSVGGGEIVEEGRDHGAARHRAHEELLLGREVAQDRGGGHAEGAADVGEGGAVEAAGDEDRTGSVEDLVAGDARWASHL